MTRPQRRYRGHFRLLFAVALVAVAGLTPARAQNVKLPIPGAQVTRASGDVVEAVLIGASSRYRHFVLGTTFEASGVRVRTAAGKTLDFILPDDAVFEDRHPRIADLDGDGRNEIVLVRSRQSDGSALVVLGLRGGALKIVAESTPNGAPNRWLNPAGIGRFLGNSRRQVALVRMPHTVGRLEFWEFDGARLSLRGSLDDVSNHRIGSSKIGLAAVLARVGRPDLLAVPSFDRRAIRIVAATPRPREIAAIPLSAPADGDFRISRTDAGFSLRVPLADGKAQTLRLGRDGRP